MRIKLDNTDRDGSVLVTTWDCEKGKRAECGAGYVRWEQGPDGIADGFAYAILDDSPGLVDELVDAGYEVCGDDYTPPDDPDPSIFECETCGADKPLSEQSEVEFVCTGCHPLETSLEAMDDVEANEWDGAP